MRKVSYYSDFTEVNFKKLKENGWKNVNSHPPSPSGWQEVLILKEKHGGDIDCIVAQWMPLDNYTKGEFRYIHGSSVDKSITSKIFLWRSLDFLEID